MARDDPAAGDDRPRTGLKVVRLIRLDDLRRSIEIKFAVASKHVRRGLGFATPGIERELIDSVMSTVADCVIVKPDAIGGGCEPKRGKFGVTEPHPFPDLIDENGQPLRFPELKL